MKALSVVRTAFNAIQFTLIQFFAVFFFFNVATSGNEGVKLNHITAHLHDKTLNARLLLRITIDETSHLVMTASRPGNKMKKW